MSVTLVEEIHEGGGDSTWDRLYQRTYTRAFRVTCSDQRDGPVTIRKETGPLTLPRVGAAYWVNGVEQDLGSFASQLSYKREMANGAAGAVWVVTVSYTPYDGGTFGPNPVDWPMLLTFGSQKFDRVVDKDQAGNPVKNSAGDPFADPVILDDSRPLVTIQRNELVSTFDPTLADDYRDKVNAAPWNGYDTKTVKCASITTTDPQYDSNNQVYYYGVTYVFEVNRDGWKKTLLDVGYSTVSTISGQPNRQARGNDGQPLTEPVLLDGSGSRLASGGTPVFIDFDVYPAVDFTAFNVDFTKAVGRS